MPGIEDIKIVLSQPTTVDNVEIDTLYIFLKEHKERPFHFIIDNDLPPKKIGKGDEAYYPGLGKKEKGFILHKNKLYFMDNAASENAQNELEISPMEFERLEKEVNLLEQRHLSYEDVKTICRYARFSSDSIKPSLTTQSSIKIVYRLDSNTKPIEKFLNWDEIKTVERQALEKALREQTSISAELEFAIKKAFIDNTKQEEKKDLDAKAQLSEDFRATQADFYLKKVQYSHALDEEIAAAQKIKADYKIAKQQAGSKSPKNKDQPEYKFNQNLYNALKKHLKELKSLKNKLDQKIEDLKQTLGPEKKSQGSPLKKSRSAFSALSLFTPKAPKTYVAIASKISQYESRIEAAKKNVATIVNRINQGETPDKSSVPELLDNSALSMSHSGSQSPLPNSIPEESPRTGHTRSRSSSR